MQKSKTDRAVSVPTADNFVKISYQIARSGKSLTSSAKAVYLLLRTYNPCRPGIRRIAREAGMVVSTAQQAIEELVAKQLIHRSSGRGGKKTNQYQFLSQDRWLLQRITVPIIGTQEELIPGKICSAYRLPVQGVLINGTGGVPINGKELDQYEIDQLKGLVVTKESTAPRYNLPNKTIGGEERAGQRSPNGQDLGEGKIEKGGASRSISDLMPELQMQIRALQTGL